MKSLLRNKKAQSTAFSWVYGLVTLAGITLLFIIFSQIFNSNLAPLIKNMADDSMTMDNATKQQVISGIDSYLLLFNIFPYVLFFCVVIFMFLASARKEQTEF